MSILTHINHNLKILIHKNTSLTYQNSNQSRARLPIDYLLFQTITYTLKHPKYGTCNLIRAKVNILQSLRARNQNFLTFELFTNHLTWLGNTPNQILILNYVDYLALRKIFVERNLENFEQMSKNRPRVQGKEEERI